MYFIIDLCQKHIWVNYKRNKIFWDNYSQTSNKSHTLVGNKLVDHSDVVGASPVGTVPTTSSLSTYHLASMDWAKTVRIILVLGFGAPHIRDFTVGKYPGWWCHGSFCRQDISSLGIDYAA